MRVTKTRQKLFFFLEPKGPEASKIQNLCHQDFIHTYYYDGYIYIVRERERKRREKQTPERGKDTMAEGVLQIICIIFHIKERERERG